MGFGVGTARTTLSTATIFMESSSRLSQGVGGASRARRPLTGRGGSIVRRPPYNGSVMAALPGRGPMMPARASSYDAGAAAYDRLTGRWSRLYVPSLVAAAGVAEGHSVLDVAAGTGEATVGPRAAGRGRRRVMAVDLSLPMLRVATGKLAGRRVRVAVMDGQRLACRPQRFDAVVCQLGLMFFAEPVRGLAGVPASPASRRPRRGAGVVAARPRPLLRFLADALSRHLPPEQRETLYLPSRWPMPTVSAGS